MISRLINHLAPQPSLPRPLPCSPGIKEAKGGQPHVAHPPTDPGPAARSRPAVRRFHRYRRRSIRRRPVSRPASLDVVPDAEVDARVADEVVKANRILEDLNASNVLASPYLVSAFYYHDGFLDDFPVDRTSAAPERRIIGQIGNLLTPETKVRFVRLLHEIWSQSNAPGPSRYAVPVAYRAVSGQIGRASCRER